MQNHCTHGFMGREKIVLKLIIVMEAGSLPSQQGAEPVTSAVHQCSSSMRFDEWK